ncbi:MAG: tRNA uridine-5-carboxymethylaminomethyl(34) synthesis GTPase MnmE [Terrimicrobiaceae bacterium]|nr:tRNA uridine-5-carboxymethylaminomethyl(34) synthesis GTPase MnmE [Terrimicrobiaceae bacterium]
MEETIAAISTPPGEGAVALIRVSGPGAQEVAQAILRRSGRPMTLVARKATLCDVVESDRVVDEVLATWFQKPASFTGEDVLEIACHGGILLAAQILEIVLRAGARAAEPGEFTRRAFLNGRMDLTRAEAVMDLIRARTPLALRAAAEQLRGRLGDEIAAIRADLLELVVHVEAWIDFPEEGIDPATGAALLSKVNAAVGRIENLLATATEGRILREGVRVAIVGKPNAGKSSLLNRLLGLERAIVSPVPGTTRDTIEESACLNGILFRLTDTAGLRETEDPVEREGVARSRRAIENADLILHVVDASDFHEDPELGTNEILVANKCDIGGPVPEHAQKVSALTGEGLDALVRKMASTVGAGHLASGQSLAAVNARHKVLLEQARSSLTAGATLLKASEPPELTAIELRSALDAVGRIIGTADTEEILGGIFGTFCIGK